MTQPSVNIHELDGALGIMPASSSTMLALYGVSTAGPSVPVAYGTVPALKAALVGGPLLEAACWYVERYGNPVLIKRATDANPGSFPSDEDGFLAPVRTGTGTSVVTLDPDATSDGDYEVRVTIVRGGTRGTTGITYRYSLDGGRTWSKTLGLGTAVAITLGATGIEFALAAGTMVAGDSWTVAAFAPTPDGTELADDLASLGLSVQPWDILEYVGPCDSTIAAALDAFVAQQSSAHKPRAWCANAAVPLMANDLTVQSEDAYATAVGTAMANYETTYGTVCAGDVRIRSSVTGAMHRRPVVMDFAARSASVSEEVNIAEVVLGPIPSATIKDAQGNPECHDESTHPGLDDLRFAVLRSHARRTGAYYNRPRLFSGETSDFQLMPHRRVMNLAHVALYEYFLLRLNQDVIVDPETGFILESEAVEMETGATTALRTALGAEPKASAWSVVVSRTDNVLSTKTITVQARIVPLAYIETIDITLGFRNPALVTVTA